MNQTSILGLTLAAAIAPIATAQAPPTPTQTQSPTMIASHQIDRYEAIRQLQGGLKSSPDNKADWIILGELAHEVAFELPSGQDATYYKISREAYERALALDPNNAGLRAAVAFAREQEADAAVFDTQRRRGVAAYLAARRRELAAPGSSPTLRVYAQPAQTPAGSKPYAAYPTYQPYAPAQGQPFTYRQYSSGTLPSVSSTAASMTPRVGQSNPASTGGAVKPAAASAPP